MIFAHAPFGILTAYLTKKIWAKNISRGQYCWLLVIPAIGSIFPDIDLFYYYLFSATFSHHEVLTHGFFVYFIVCAVLFFIGCLLKKEFIKKASCLFLLGIFSHLISDSISAGVIWLAPFSYEMYGLASFFWYNKVFESYFFTVNYSLEILICSLFLLLILQKILKSKKIWLLISILFLILNIFSACGLYYINLHLYRTTNSIYYGDYDHDNLANRHDFDLDGDGILNINDPDIDGDGIKNKKQLYAQAKNLPGIYYDLTEGGFLEIPLRMGLVTNIDFVRRTFDAQGIFIKEEMMSDYRENSGDYATDPQRDAAFDRNISNWQAWLKHKDKLIIPDDNNALYAGDILFFHDQIVAIFLNQEKILIASKKDKKVISITMKNAVVDYGNIQQVGRALAD